VQSWLQYLWTLTCGVCVCVAPSGCLRCFHARGAGACRTCHGPPSGQACRGACSTGAHRPQGGCAALPAPPEQQPHSPTSRCMRPQQPNTRVHSRACLAATSRPTRCAHSDSRAQAGCAIPRATLLPRSCRGSRWRAGASSKSLR